MSFPGTKATVRRFTWNVSKLKDLARSIAERFCQFGKACCRWISGPSDPRHRLGLAGEKAAAKFLRKNGYKVLYRNFRGPKGGEVDLVCRDKKAATLVFIEVKTRSRTDYGAPGTAVDRDKQSLIARGAMTWLRLLDREDVPFRFDIVEVIASNGTFECNLIQNAFTLPQPLRW
jgi:putative endonuclease